MRARQIRGSITLPLTPTQQSSFNNGPALLLPKYRTAIAKTKSGQANTNIALLGDSTTLGVGALNVAGTGNLKPYAYPTQLMQMFNASGVNSHANSFFGFGAIGDINNSNSDSRIVYGVDWSGFSGTSLGGPLWQTPSTSVTALSFTPTAQVDTFTIYYVTNTGLGTMAIDINGGTATLQSTNAAVGVGSVSVSGALGINTVNINYSSGTSGFFIIAIIGYDSSKKWAHFANIGWSGAKASDIASTSAAYSPANALAAYAPDLTVIMDGINDWSGAVSLATYQTNMQTVITKAKLSGDVILVSPIPSSTTVTSAANQQGYVDVLSALSTTNNIPFINYYSRAGLWANNQAMYTQSPSVDSKHYNMIGYNDISQAIFNVIGNV